MNELNYDFPIIEHIDDIWPHIEPIGSFFKADKPEHNFTVINYLVGGTTTFPPVECGNRLPRLTREARGIKFDLTTGKIISRPYHKFFNLGEREELTGFPSNLLMLEKLDGSMVTPLKVNGSWTFVTKMGVTDTALKANKHPHSSLAFALAESEPRFTFIFEYCSNDNRIILSYPHPRLVLTGVRENISGTYAHYHVLVMIADSYGLEVVKTLNIRDIKEYQKNNMDDEGIVGRDPITSHMLKVKTDWYVKVHKAKDALNSERSVVSMIVNETMDDFLPTLPEDVKPQVLSYIEDFYKLLKQVSKGIFLAKPFYKSRKELGLDNCNHLLKVPLFNTWDLERLTLGDVEEEVIDVIKDHLGSNESFRKVKEAYFPKLVYDLVKPLEE